MSRNPAFGKWSEEETNWSQKDTDLIADILNEETVPTSYKELLDEYELGMKEEMRNLSCPNKGCCYAVGGGVNKCKQCYDEYELFVKGKK